MQQRVYRFWYVTKSISFYLFIFHPYAYVFVDIYESYDKIYMSYKSYLTRNNSLIDYNTVIGI